jgi:hypothetical protein
MTRVEVAKRKTSALLAGLFDVPHIGDSLDR